MKTPVSRKVRSITVLFAVGVLLALPVRESASTPVSLLKAGALDAAKTLAEKAPMVAKQVESLNKLPMIVDLVKKGAKALDASDDKGLPDYEPPGMPQVPIGCGSDKPDADIEDCHHCYHEAHQKLEDLRRHFERLRQLYVETDDMVKAQVAFGDGISGSVGVGALEWISQREKIMRSFKQFTAVYNNKHQELLGRLEKVLREIGECERQYFGDADWYNRYGFIFHSFMSLHYAR